MMMVQVKIFGRSFHIVTILEEFCIFFDKKGRKKTEINSVNFIFGDNL